MQRSSVDQNDRTATELLLYADPVVIPSNLPGAIVSQKWVRDLINLMMPVGTIIIWSGSIASIPAGWTLCNGVPIGAVVPPNLSGRFVMSTDASGYYPGLAGGNYTHGHTITVNNHILTWGQMPYHTHALSDPSHAHGQRQTSNVSVGGHSAQEGGSGGAIDTQAPTQYVTTGVSIAASGGNEPHNHGATASVESLLPPYWVLCYIMKYVNL